MPDESTWVTGVAVGGFGVLVGGTPCWSRPASQSGGGAGRRRGGGVFGMQLIVTRSGPALSGWSASTVTAVPAQCADLEVQRDFQARIKSRQHRGAGLDVHVTSALTRDGSAVAGAGVPHGKPGH